MFYVIYSDIYASAIDKVFILIYIICMVSVSELWDVCLREPSAGLHTCVLLFDNSYEYDVDTHYHTFSGSVFFKPVNYISNVKGCV